MTMSPKVRVPQLPHHVLAFLPQRPTPNMQQLLPEATPSLQHEVVHCLLCLHQEMTPQLRPLPQPSTSCLLESEPTERTVIQTVSMAAVLTKRRCEDGTGEVGA